MQDAQYPVPAPNRSQTSLSRVTSARLSRSILVGVAVSLLLTCIEIAILWMLYPFHPAVNNALTRLSTVLALPIHIPLLWLIPLVEIVGISLIAFRVAKPLAIRAYLRDVQRAQEAYCTNSTALRSLADVYHTPVTYYQHTPDPVDSNREEKISLHELPKLYRDTSLLLMGAAGAGKTLALQQYLYHMSQRPRHLKRGQHKIGLYIPLKNYNIFLKKHQPGVSTADIASGEAKEAEEAEEAGNEQLGPSHEVVPQGTFLSFLLEGDLSGTRHLRPYLRKLLEQGQFCILCDGLDEVDDKYRLAVGRELAELLLVTQNRFIISCREVDYQQQQKLMELVNGGHLEYVVIEPLPLDIVRQFVEQYIHDQGNHWQHTAGQIMQIIEHSRLRYICTNPLLLLAFMEIIDTVGVERGKKLDTRGSLLREYIARLIKRTQGRSAWRQNAPTEQEVTGLLGRIAFAARWSHDPDALQLPPPTSQGRAAHVAAVAEELLAWLGKHPPQSVFEAEQSEEDYDAAQIAHLLQFAQDAGLIDISAEDRPSHDGRVLSFRHELLADYFVAAYCSDAGQQGEFAFTTLTEDILAKPGYWSVPIALWAGLMDNPAQLAEQFIILGNNHPDYTLSATALGLICLGVTWTPPQAPLQRGNTVPHVLTTALTEITRNDVARVELAAILTRCADEGAFEIYYALLPLLMVENIGEFLVQLNASTVLKLLFTYLRDAVDIPAYEGQVKRLSRVLWHFGTEAVSYASPLIQAVPGRSIRLRAATINILGGTQSAEAVKPLMEQLGDADPYVVKRAGGALIRLGPNLSLTPVLAELENHTASAFIRQVHAAILHMLERLLSTQDGEQALAATQTEHVFATLIHMLGTDYSWEPDLQEQVRALLVRHSKRQGLQPSLATTSSSVAVVGTIARETQEQVIAQLIRFLASGDEMQANNIVQTLQEIGNAATPQLLRQLRQQPPESVRMRIVEILQRVQDNRALPDILRLIADNSPLVQKQVTSALQTYGDESIIGLLDLIVTDPDELVAERAAHILSDMGEKVVHPITQAMSRIVPGRTRLLVQILDTIHDPTAIPALTTLLREAQGEPLLAIAVIHTLSHFATQQVVEPILQMLANPHVQIYEEAIEALSSLGLTALTELIAALDSPQETAATARVRRAMLGIMSFPGQQLLNSLPQDSNVQAQQIMTIFQMQGAEAAHTLVQNLFHENERTRRYVRQTLSELPGPTAVPPLLEALTRLEWRSTLADFLLKFPEAAIPPLVHLLDDPERDEAAAAILPRFGAEILPALISGLDHPTLAVQEHAKNIMVVLVRQNPLTLSQVVQLFTRSLPLRAHEALLEVLTNELDIVSIPALLAGLEDAHLIDDVSEALVRMARKRDWQQTVLSGLLSALYTEERRRGAETALIKTGALAVRPVGEMIIDEDPVVARAAQHILSAIGVPALPFVWTAHGDTSNRARRDAAMNIFHAMPTDVIKDALVDLLGSDQPEDMAMAQALLLERIHDEMALPQANHEMIPALFDYVQIHDRERSSLRILALLLLIGGNQVITHLVQVLYDYPEHHEQLAYAFLFLGDEAHTALVNILHDQHAPAQLRAEIMSIIGLLGPYKDLYEYAQSLSSYGLSLNRTSILKPDQLAIALRALGSLLASGDWDISTLQNLLRITPEGSSQSELYHVLLGWRYEPIIARLKDDLQNEREARNNEIMNLTARIVQDRSHIHELEEELEQVRHEHGQRGDELFQATQEREDFRSNLEQALQERDTLRINFNQSMQEREVFRSTLEKTLQEKQVLQAEIAHLEDYNAQLQQQIRILHGTQ
ncbi:MAG: HEAT repeat domain-containing protein [Ktedonobacteraceae bacterium]